MTQFSVEIKSALWQKIFAAVVFLPFVGAGVACWLSPFVPIFAGEAPSVWEAAFYGTIVFAFGFVFLWTILRYSLRADAQGIHQSNGFFQQSVRWEEVAHYYVEPNPRFHKERRLHIEPVLFDRDNQIIFRGFAHILVSTRKILEQRRLFWEFVEAQLAGKKIEAPHPDINFTPEVLARRSLEVDWKTKTVSWKIARVIGLVVYALFWVAMTMAPAYYSVTHNIGHDNSGSKFWLLLLSLFSMTLGPLLPYFIRLQIKKRKISRDWEKRDKVEL